ncbi:MAG TPA: hypothetical protein VGC30_09790 [Dokdonella sp.]
MKSASYVALAASAALISLAVTTRGHADELDVDGPAWKQIASGVYEKIDEDGTVTRRSFGPDGAAYDRAVLSARLSELSRKSQSALSDGEHDEIRGLELALDGIAVSDSSIVPVPFDTQGGTMCSRFYYGLDSHFVVGRGGATTVSRSGANDDGFGPPPPVATYSVYTSSVVTPHSGSPITVTQTNATGAPVSALADFRAAKVSTTALTSGACSGSSYSYVQISSTICSPNPGFESLTKTYSTCVSSP